MIYEIAERLSDWAWPRGWNPEARMFLTGFTLTLAGLTGLIVLIGFAM